ncbi:MAG: hypothetical protein M2R45_02726 [Verrucomicrobia subdivision 3 bacterium]|nr:hypothetical protein [Limisphaerales bacterium]MCS1415066.1 hypothetical protein [Limisphaerales bacterium]
MSNERELSMGFHVFASSIFGTRLPWPGDFANFMAFSLRAGFSPLRLGVGPPPRQTCQRGGGGAKPDFVATARTNGIPIFKRDPEIGNPPANLPAAAWPGNSRSEFLPSQSRLETILPQSTQWVPTKSSGLKSGRYVDTHAEYTTTGRPSKIVPCPLDAHCPFAFRVRMIELCGECFYGPSDVHGREETTITEVAGPALDAG